jgi:uncharacterized protein (TIGR03083 family)
MLHHPTSVRTAFAAQAELFRSTVAAISDDQWQLSGVGEWTVRETLAHATRAFLTIEQGLVDPPEDAAIDAPTAADYFRRALSGDNEQLHQQIAERARATADRLGDDVRQSALDHAERIARLVTDLADDTWCLTAGGWMTLGEFLVTRMEELVIHTADLQRATGQPETADPQAAMLVRDLLLSIADRVDPLAVCLALTGRGSANVLS